MAGTTTKRQFYIQADTDLIATIRDAAAARGLSQAGYVRQAIMAALKLDGMTPFQRETYKRLRPQDIIKLDQQLRAMGVDLAKAVKDQ